MWKATRAGAQFYKNTRANRAHMLYLNRRAGLNERQLMFDSLVFFYNFHKLQTYSIVNNLGKYHIYFTACLTENWRGYKLLKISYHLNYRPLISHEYLWK